MATKPGSTINKINSLSANLKKIEIQFEAIKLSLSAKRKQKQFNKKTVKNKVL